MNRWVEGQVVDENRGRTICIRCASMRRYSPSTPASSRSSPDIDGSRWRGRAPGQLPMNALEFHFVAIPQGPLTDRLQALRRRPGLGTGARRQLFTLSEVPDAPAVAAGDRHRHRCIHLAAENCGTVGPSTRSYWPRRPTAASWLTKEIAGFAAAHAGHFTCVPMSPRGHRFRSPRRIHRRSPIAGSRTRRTHAERRALQVMICGNPGMVRDSIQVLEARGLPQQSAPRPDRSPPNTTGNHRGAKLPAARMIHPPASADGIVASGISAAIASHRSACSSRRQTAARTPEKRRSGTDRRQRGTWYCSTPGERRARLLTIRFESHPDEPFRQRHQPPSVLTGFIACVLLLAYAFYLQYVSGLEPCPLCILQRIAVIAWASFS